MEYDEYLENGETSEKKKIGDILEVSQIVDEYSVYALSAIFNDEMLVEFEHGVDYKVGDRISITGSLELRKKEDN